MFKKIVIVGCGLIGTSIALAAKKNKISNFILGVDNSKINLDKIPNSFDKVYSSIKDVGKADLLILSSPISSFSKIFDILINDDLMKKFRIITEVASSKKLIIKKINSFDTKKKVDFLTKYISSHPLAGSEKSGFLYASPDLFLNATVLLSSSEYFMKENENKIIESNKIVNFENLQLLVGFWESLGAKRKIFPIEEHDYFLAFISHFPHLIAFSLGEIISNSKFNESSQETYGGGLKDTTRVAASSPDLWAGIFFDNKDYLIELMDKWSLHWVFLRETLKNSDHEKLKSLLSNVSDWRNGFK